jgi:hypothetical protein
MSYVTGSFAAPMQAPISSPAQEVNDSTNANADAIVNNFLIIYDVLLVTKYTAYFD